MRRWEKNAVRLILSLIALFLGIMFIQYSKLLNKRRRDITEIISWEIPRRDNVSEFNDTNYTYDSSLNVFDWNHKTYIWDDESNVSVWKWEELSEVTDSRASQRRWKENFYIRDDGILPYAKCGSDSSFSDEEAVAIFSQFRYKGNNQLYDILVLAASLWGESEENGRPLSFRVAEFLIYFTEYDRECVKDEGNHCQLPYLDPSLLDLTCKFEFSQTLFTYETKGFVRLIENTKDPKAQSVAVALCPMQDLAMTSLFWTDNNQYHFLDLWTVSLTINESIPIRVPMCYQHVSAKQTISAVLCTQPMYGYDTGHNNPFWTGSPPYRNHTLLHAFLYHHIYSLGMHVRFNDLTMEFSRHLKLLNIDNQWLSYRPNWKIERLPHNTATYAFEILAESVCHWDFRLRARWSMIVHSVDNFVLPNHTGLFSETLDTLPADVSSVVVPIVQGISCCMPREGHNILQQYSRIGPSLSFDDSRHTPLCNPRHVYSTWVHWNTGRNPLLFKREIDFIEAYELLKLQTLHVMALTRPQLDVYELGRSHDALNEYGRLLERHIKTTNLFL